MFKCTGICSRCGKCKNAALMTGANDRKTRLLAFPADFVPDKGMAGYGAAFDIGTTTVVGMLWDLQSGAQVCSCARTNPQNEFGMDVISRINFCGEDGTKLQILREKIIGCLNDCLAELCAKSGAEAGTIFKAAVCGNTTMSHIFAGFSPVSLASVPFAPAYQGMLELSAGESGLNLSKRGKVLVLPNIAGHVGGDITAGIAASRLLTAEALTVFIDIGTNGEIALSDGRNKYACSTAAGPAFEGASVLHGMRAAAGAIEKVLIEDGEVFYRTIGECEPQGICGSGIIDAIAQMLKNRLINPSGRLICAEDVDPLKLDKTLKDRLISEGKERQFILARKAGGESITVTQSDIREIQLAKGAVAAGMRLLLGQAGKTAEDIDRLIVAGAFGSCIDKESAAAIGLLPKIDPEKIVFAGNAAGAGVSMALMSEEELRTAVRVPNEVVHVELADHPDFQDVYLDSMGFEYP